MDPTLKYGLIGAGAGAGLGAAANILVGDKKKDKVKQALKGVLVGGALGGAAGAGLGYFRDSVGFDFLKDKKPEEKTTTSVSEKLKGKSKESEEQSEEQYVPIKPMEDARKATETKHASKHDKFAKQLAQDPEFVNYIKKYDWDKKGHKDLTSIQEKPWYDIWESEEERLLRSPIGRAYLELRASGKNLEDLAKAYEYLNNRQS